MIILVIIGICLIIQAKRSMSEFKNKILQTINNNNLFRNKNNMLNKMKHFNPPSIKNINTQNSGADNESPVKKPNQFFK